MHTLIGTAARGVSIDRTALEPWSAHRLPAGSLASAIGFRHDVSCRITFVQTHPVQYMAPLFRHIATQRGDIDLTVLYASAPMPDQQGVGFDESFEWDVTLTDGYAHRVLQPPAAGRHFGSDSFLGADVGSVAEAIAETQPDVVVVPGWHSAFYLRAIAACRRRGIPVVYRGDSQSRRRPRRHSSSSVGAAYACSVADVRRVSQCRDAEP